MRFRSVDIFELVTDNEYALVGQVRDVRVGYRDARASAHDDNGAVLAEMTTFDDDPVEIGDDYVKIAGILTTHRTTKSASGYWLCRPVGAGNAGAAEP